MSTVHIFVAEFIPALSDNTGQMHQRTKWAQGANVAKCILIFLLSGGGDREQSSSKWGRPITCLKKDWTCEHSHQC